MTQSIKDYYLRLHSTRNLITELSAFYKGMKSTNDDIFKSQVSSGETNKQLRRQLIGMKQALLDTTTGGYFLKDIASGAAFNEGLPPFPEDYFSVLFDSKDVFKNMFLIHPSVDSTAYTTAALASQRESMSVKDVVSPCKSSQPDSEKSIDLKATATLQNDNPGDSEVVLKKDKDGNPVYGLTASSEFELLEPKINQNVISVPDRFTNPSLGAVVLKRQVQSEGKSSGFSIANRNSDLINLFFNAIPPIEMSRCVPFINMYIITPKNATVSEFNNVSFMRFTQASNGIFGLDDKSGVGNSIPVGLASFDTRIIVDKQITGMDIFLSPQMMSNANVRSSAISSGKATITGEKILEPISPFLTLESVSTNISSAGQALLQSKTASFKIKLHDRSRLKDVAPLISPEQFGMTKVYLEYGWSHPDSDITSSNDFGRLLNSLRDVGIYTVKSSNFGMGTGNTVDITVELACMGGNYEAKNITAAAGIAVPLKVLRPVIEKTAEGIINEKIGAQATDAKLKEVRTILKVNTRKANSGKSLVLYEKFVELASAAGFSGNTKATNAELIRLFSHYVNPDIEPMSYLGNDNGIPVLSIDNSGEGKALSEENIVSLLYGKLYGMTDSSSGRDTGLGSSTKLNRTPDPFINDSSHFATSADTGTIEGVSEYALQNVSLGKVLLSFIGYSMAVSGRCDEVQMFFYPLNNQAGKARSLTTASFPISKYKLVDMLKEVTRDKQKTDISTKAFFSLIEKTFIQDRKNNAYGLSDVYTSIEARNKSLKEESEQLKKDITAAKLSSTYIKMKTSEEREQHLTHITAQYDANKKSYAEQNKNTLNDTLASIYAADGLDLAVENKFVIPNLSMLIETVPALGPTKGLNFNNALDLKESDMFEYMKEAQGTKQITRIHIYDERAAANSDAKFYQQLIEGGAITMSPGAISGKDTTDEKSDEKSVFIVSPRNAISNDNKNEVQDVQMASEITTADLKDLIKDYFPSITLGTNNSVIKSISANSSTSGAVSNVLLLNSLGNKKIGTPGGSDLIDQEEVRVIPSTIKLECLGLPVIQRGNQVYIDMGTGTTLDNIYTVTNVQHILKPGDFSTSLTLTCTNQGDTDALKTKIEKATMI
jgi:hypothetical protein